MAIRAGSIANRFTVVLMSSPQYVSKTILYKYLKNERNMQKLSPQSRIVTVEEGSEGQRLDNFLFSRLKGVPKSHVYRILRTGQVRVNGRRIKPDYRVEPGDAIRLPPVRQGEERAPEAPGSRLQALIREAVLYEDDSLLILNKPPGIAVHAGSGLDHGVIEILRALRPQQPFIELAHRLDRETSGCLLIAKTRPMLKALHDLLRQGGIGKHYLALVKGRWRGGARGVTAALEKQSPRTGQRKVQVSDAGKAAATQFAPRQIYRDVSLLEVTLDTGRTHQIRVHAAHIEHPLAGDDKYGDWEFNRRMKAQGLKRLFLHAHRLAFTLPGGRKIALTAPLPDDLQQILDRLEMV